ncbi:MAG: hypothetical protein P8R42_24120 [Candidatus Binatia bacterium]|nr:hypothetical protein [Candidatus Binatia bacterium]
MALAFRTTLALVLIATIAVAISHRIDGRPGVVTVYADRTVGVVRPIWDEVNLWKLLATFGVHRPDPAEMWGGEGWLRRAAPWLRYARVVAPLGGNYAPEIAEACDHRQESEGHVPNWECGQGGHPGVAAVNESMRWVDGEWVVDYSPFRTSLQRLLRSGVRPHLNLSATPVAFTGGTGDFRHYHWNAKPPEDLEGWLDYVRDAFASVEDLDRTGWRVSIINEPNCLIPDENGDIQHVGFASNPDGYASTWTAAARTVSEIAPEVVVHPGNYVTSDTFEGEDNLQLYLASLGAELEAAPDLSWEGLPYIGMSLYEVPDTTLEDFRATRIRRLIRAQTDNGLAKRPIKIDELGLHVNVRRPFEAEADQPLRTTRFAGSWFAEAQRSFIDAGDVVSSAPWLKAIVQMPSLKPLPAGHVYGMLGLLAGQLETSSESGEPIALRTSGHEDGLPRLATRVGPGPGLRPESTLRAIATGTGEGIVRIFVVHHQPTPLKDGDPRQEELAREVRVEVAGLPAGSYSLRHASIGGRGGAVWNGEEVSPLLWHVDGCVTSTGERVRAPDALHMPANSVWLFEIEPRAECQRA